MSSMGWSSEEADKAKQLVSKVNGVRQVIAFFDIISEAEKQRLEKEGKARTSQPDTNPTTN